MSLLDILSIYTSFMILFWCSRYVLFILARHHAEFYCVLAPSPGAVSRIMCFPAVHVLFWPESCCSISGPRVAVPVFCCPLWTLIQYSVALRSRRGNKQLQSTRLDHSGTKQCFLGTPRGEMYGRKPKPLKLISILDDVLLQSRSSLCNARSGIREHRTSYCRQCVTR